MFKVTSLNLEAADLNGKEIIWKKGGMHDWLSYLTLPRDLL